jgi:hypothetical protein
VCGDADDQPRKLRAEGAPGVALALFRPEMSDEEIEAAIEAMVAGPDAPPAASDRPNAR